MKKFEKNIVAKILSSSHQRVTKDGASTRLQWGKSMSQIGDGYIYILSWISNGDEISWRERDQDYNIVHNTGMTCICDDINLEGDGLFVTIEALESAKPDILAIAEKIYAETKNLAIKPENKKQENGKMTAEQRKLDAIKNANSANSASMKEVFNAVANAFYLERTQKSFEELNEYLSYEQSSWADGLNGTEWHNIDDCIGCAEEAASQYLEEEEAGN